MLTVLYIICWTICSNLIKTIESMQLGTNCASLAADLFLISYERDSISSLSENNQDDVIGAFKSTSRYLDD